MDATVEVRGKMEIDDFDCVNWCPICGEPRSVCESYGGCDRADINYWDDEELEDATDDNS